MLSLLQKFLFTLEPERAHAVAVQSLQLAYHLGLSACFAPPPSCPLTLMGLNFNNPIGLAAGFDKNADYVDALAMLGFGFIEVGTLTPKPQAGNPCPRLFRLTPEKAIINRMGFNNKGVEYAARRLEKTRYRGVLGINIGKNRDTPLENALEDYLFAFRVLWPFASYITINISSPNTAGLRELQQEDLLTDLLSTLKNEQQKIAKNQNKYVPLVVKISPDLSDPALYNLANVLLKQNIDGVIATNTTLSREGVQASKWAKETGGLSGAPLSAPSTAIIKKLHAQLKNAIPIIASGGVMDTVSAREKIEAGASLLQVYTGFIYSGPKIISHLSRLYIP